MILESIFLAASISFANPQNERVDLNLFVVDQDKTPIQGASVYLPKTGEYLVTDSAGMVFFQGPSESEGYWEVGQGHEDADLKVEVYFGGKMYPFRRATNFNFKTHKESSCDGCRAARLSYSFQIGKRNDPGTLWYWASVWASGTSTYWTVTEAEELDCVAKPDPDNQLFINGSLSSISYPDTCSGIASGNATTTGSIETETTLDGRLNVKTSKLFKSAGINVEVGGGKTTKIKKTTSLKDELPGKDRPNEKGAVHIRTRYVKYTLVKYQVTSDRNGNITAIKELDSDVILVPTGTCQDTSDLESC